MMHELEKYNKLEKELKESCKDFFHFSFELVQSITKENNNLKFAVVNMQIALELFLKFYFLEKKEYDLLFSNPEKLMFRDFAVILDRFFSKDNDLLVTKKKHLKNILDERNNIVHKGKFLWNEELAINLINTTLFIQNVLNREYTETLIETSYGYNNLSSNLIWRNGTQNFAKNIAALHNLKIYECPFCYSHSFIDKKIFTCDELGDEGFQCVTCFNSYYLHDQIGLAKCCVCGDNAFVLDCLNPQENGNKYIGRCLECNFYHYAYKCDNCDAYITYVDDNVLVRVNNNIFCSKKCCEEDKKIQQIKNINS